jgi:type I restriction enzyme S subunit
MGLTAIGECANILSGFAFNSSGFNTERKGLPVARIRDVNRGHSETYYDGPHPENFVIRNGDILVGMDGEFNLGVWSGGRALLNQRVCRVTPKPDSIDRSYLKHALPLVLHRIEARTPFVTVKHLSGSDLEEELIALPPLSDQIVIGRRLDVAERLQRIRRFALATSQELLGSVFLEMFGDPAEIGRMPRKRLSDLFSAMREGVKCGPFGTALKNSEYVNSGIPVWTIVNLTSEGFRPNGSLFVTREKARQLKGYSAQWGDILISRAGTVGRMAIIDAGPGEAIIHTNLVRLTLDPVKLLNDYFVTLMTIFGNRVARLKRGQEDAYSFLSAAALPDLVIPVPSIEAQRAFSRFVSQYRKQRKVYLEAIRQAEHLFQTLLHEAFGDAG